MTNELTIYNKAVNVVNLLDRAYASDELTTAKINKISRLLGEVEFTICGDRRGAR